MGARSGVRDEAEQDPVGPAVEQGAEETDDLPEGSGPPSLRPRSARVARNRRRRSDEFLAAALRIVIDDGFESLTMARLAREVDAAVGSVYRYYASKDHLMAEVQTRAVDRLARSFDESVPPLVEALTRALEPASAPFIPLMALGRWACAASLVLPEEVRLLQMVSARRTSALGPGGGEALVPTVMSFVTRALAIFDEATTSGAIDPGPALPRAIMWLTALGGVLEADDLEEYLPDVLGGARLARQFTLDLYAGWGADRVRLEEVDRAIDDIVRDAPLAR